MALIDNLERYYKLNGTGVDEVAGANGTVLPGVVFVDGVLGQSARFDGIPTRGVVAPGLNLLSDLTVTHWVRYKATGGQAYCPSVANMDAGGGTDLNYGVLQNGTSLLFYGKSNSTYSAANVTLVQDVFAFVVFTRTASGVAKAWKNATLIGTGSGPVPWSVPAADLRIGNREDGYSGFSGDICQVAVWSRVLSDAEISQLYNGGAGLPFGSFRPAPVLTSVSPTSGLTTGGTAITLTGTGFVSGATVSVGGVAATSVVLVSATQISALAPAGAVGAAAVVVTNPDAQSSLLAGGFTYVSPVLPVFVPTVTKYGTHLARLLPPGAVWNLQGDGKLHKLLLGTGDEFARVEARSANLLEETDPRTATETLADWERMVSLPDEVVTAIPATTAARRVAVTQKYVGRGGQNGYFFETLCAACGYPLVSITRYAPLRVGFRVQALTPSDASRVFGDTFAYVMRVTVGVATAGALTVPQFEAAIRSRTHAHIQVVFSY